MDVIRNKGPPPLLCTGAIDTERNPCPESIHPACLVNNNDMSHQCVCVYSLIERMGAGQPI